MTQQHTSLAHLGWSLARSGDEILVAAPDADPGSTYVANKGSLHQRLLFAMADAILGKQDELSLARLDVADQIKSLCVNGDLPDEFQQVADWVAAGAMPKQFGG